MEKDGGKKIELVLIVLVLITICSYFILNWGGITGAVVGVDQAEVDPEIKYELQGKEEVSVIVVLKDDVDSVDLEERKVVVAENQEEVLEDLELEDREGFLGINKEQEFELEHQYVALNAFAGEVTEEGLEKLENDPKVEKVIVNKVKHIFLSDSVPLMNGDDVWGLEINGVAINGTGETVCVIDTGIDYNHSGLGDGWGNKVLDGYDFYNDDADPMDDHGHGTHVAGIAASEDETYRGMAPDANLIAMKVCSAGGSCPDADVLAGIEWCIDNASVYNISVISISLGGDQYTGFCDNDPNVNATYATLINTAVANNISVVAATGNTNVNYPDALAGIAAPGCVESALRVTATDKSDNMASYAFRHSNFTDVLAATGSSITSLWKGGGYQSGYSGTSMATPHVSGAAALMQQYNKLRNGGGLSPAEVRATLDGTGVNIDDSGGSGLNFSRINAYAAMQYLNGETPGIDFVVPTPDEGAQVNNSFIINVTASEMLSSALLEWDGANVSMSGSKVSWYSVREVARGNYSYKVYAVDLSNEENETEERVVEVFNNDPVVGGVNITLVADETDDLICSYTASDLDNDSLVVDYNWYRNGTVYDFEGNNLSSGNTSIGEIWGCGVAVNDGYVDSIEELSLNVTITASALDAPTLVYPITSWVNSLSVGFDWSDVAGVSEYTVEVSNDSEFSVLVVDQVSGGSNYTAVLEEKSYWWRVKSCSNCTYSENKSFTIDVTSPAVLGADPGTVNNSFFTGSFTVNDTNLEICVYNLSNASGEVSSGTKNSVGEHNVVFSGLSDGNYDLEVECNDSAGWSNSSVALGFSVSDSVAPTASLSTSESGSSEVTVTLTATTNEAASCRCDVANANYSALNGSMSGTELAHTFDYDYDSDDSGTYYVRCNDTKGNVMSTSSTTSFNVDVDDDDSSDDDSSDSGSSSPGGSGPSGGGGPSTTAAATDETASEPVAMEAAANSGGSEEGTSGGSEAAAVEIDFSAVEETSLSLAAGESKTFSLDGVVPHSIKIDEVTEETATITISSDPVTITLEVGDDEKVDVEDDGTNDLVVTLNSIVEGVADLTIKKYTSGGFGIVGMAVGFFNGIKSGLRSSLSWIGFVVILLIAVLYIVKRKKKEE